MKWLLRKCGCWSKAVDDIYVDEICNLEVDIALELKEAKELKENREDTKSRILGIDVESSKLREVIDGQIVDLSRKIEKLEGI
jgi:hypothetical protein